MKKSLLSAMEKFNCCSLIFLGLLYVAAATGDSVAEHNSTSDLHTYIVHVLPNPHSDLEDWHRSFLPRHRAAGGIESSRLLYSYRSVASGFAARLTEQELRDVEKQPGFLLAYPDRLVPLQTTHTPEFLGLHRDAQGLWNDSNFGKDIIVGVLDTGISPTHPSFQSNGNINPPPAKWKGTCEFGASVCNNKLIGARNFVRGSNAMTHAITALPQAPPSDSEGHGTHTASTAAGMFVDHANVDGQASGTASGIAPYAYLAIYKVCGTGGCATSDILAAMDAAIHDGVDIVSLSLGGMSIPFYRDGIATGTFAAIQNGIFVSCAAGNSGPSYSTLSNEAPWILTVGASTLDRKVRTMVTLGNGQSFDGESLYQPTNVPSSVRLPLVYPGSTSSSAAFCSPGSLAGINVTGMVVLCDDGNVGRVSKGTTVKNAGGAGMIIANLKVQGFITFTDPHVLPASDVSYADGLKIKSYITSTAAPKASIAFKGTILGTPILAPIVAYFSSRGPNSADPNILKPDIIGPGVNILAAWPSNVGAPPTKFNLISGTSMATPHLTGVAALLKSAHPDWSPAAIKSAIMTTAGLTTNNGSLIPDQNLNAADFFAVGAGHVNPVAATNPGLVYDLSPADYVPYLCGLNYTDSQVTAIVHSTTKCADYKSISGADLNYPSFMVFVNVGNSVRVTRTVTNVGAAISTYSVQIVEPVGVSVAVDPKTLSFSKANEKAQFIVTFTGKTTGSSGVFYSEGYLTWFSDNGGISVNSPMMVAVSGGSRQSM